MSAEFTSITIEQFTQFMEGLGFYYAGVCGNEYVFENRFSEAPAKIEVYSSITPGGSRNKGKDAIRVVVKYMDNGRWIALRKLRRVHRVRNWKENLKKRIEEAGNQIYPEKCPYCRSVMVLREGQYGTFYSCTRWSQTGCQGKASLEKS